MNLKTFIIPAVVGTILLSLCLVSCKDIFEPSISKRQVKQEAPVDNYHSTTYTVSFWWDDVEDASNYRLQIVTPKFDSVSTLIADTLIKGDKFFMSLNPGVYQWRVRAENSGSRTDFSSARNLVIYNSSITQQKVQVIAPANTLLTNQSTLAFSWGSLYGATKYEIQIDTSNFADPSHLFFDQTVVGLETSITLKSDHSYQWRIRGENDTEQSAWSDIFTYTYDHTPPAAVTITAPADKQTIANPVNLQWSTSATAVKYRLYLYKSDGATPYSSSYPMVLTSTSYSFSSGISGETDYWKVTAVDAAGNESAAGTLRSFIIQ
jgi:hypothetical protein